jgi:co-chaperonin GroES (HSP10)
MIQPFGKRILVKPLENRPLPSGIVLPDNRKGSEKKWEVVLGGPETDISPGDIVLVEWVDDEFEHDGAKYGIVTEDAIMAIIR